MTWFLYLPYGTFMTLGASAGMAASAHCIDRIVLGISLSQGGHVKISRISFNSPMEINTNSWRLQANPEGCNPTGDKFQDIH